jgi:hypothetical protein
MGIEKTRNQRKTGGARPGKGVRYLETLKNFGKIKKETDFINFGAATKINIKMNSH